MTDTPRVHPQAQKESFQTEVAIDRWLKGEEYWNEWVKQTPDANVNFSSVDFSQYRDQHPIGLISFNGFKFPTGKVDFSNANFGDGDVFFSDADFGEGEVSFIGADFGEGTIFFSGIKFGKGEVSFARAKFGDGGVLFSDTDFGEGEVSFNGADFGEGTVVFSGTKFGKGEVSFDKAKFGEGSVSFGDADFGEGNVSFFRTDFGDGEAAFIRTKFGKGRVSFLMAKFGEGHVSFGDAEFGEGNVIFALAKFGGLTSFLGTTLGSGAYVFDQADFSGRVLFTGLKNTEAVKAISFQCSNLEKSIDLSGNFNCVVDLTQTKITNQVSLHDLHCKLNRERGSWKCLWQKKAVKQEDSARFRRLKELSESNKDHERSLAFHADEMRAKRWRMTGFLDSWLDVAFSGFSNYGQSIARPVIGLLGTTVGTTFYYARVFPNTLNLNQWIDLVTHAKWGSAIELAVSNSLPFIGSAKNVRSDSMKELFGEQLLLPDWFNAVSLFHGGLTFVFLFLIGLALRNRFRV